MSYFWVFYLLDLLPRISVAAIASMVLFLLLFLLTLMNWYVDGLKSALKLSKLFAAAFVISGTVALLVPSRGVFLAAYTAEKIQGISETARAKELIDLTLEAVEKKLKEAAGK